MPAPAYKVKRSAESYPFTFDFTLHPDIVGGDSLSGSPVITSNIPGLTIGTTSITGKTVKARISSGLDGQFYFLLCSDVTTNGNTIYLPGILQVNNSPLVQPQFIRAGEFYSLFFDFVNDYWIVNGDTLTGTPTVTSTGAAGLTLGAPTISGTKVVFPTTTPVLEGGYTLTCQCGTTAGQTIASAGTLWADNSQMP